jgi:hypothetical protein
MYYSDRYDSIPVGIIDKGLTGVGLTSYALENKIPTVVISPTVAMIENKVAQYPNERRAEPIQGFHSGVELSEVTKHLKSVSIPKILVTYDSFYKIKFMIDKSYQIVVDEFSDLLDAYDYRNIAISRLLKDLREFPNVSYISATPIKEEYLPEQLQGLTYTKLEWEDTTKVKVDLLHRARPLQTVKSIINKYKAGLVEINGIKSHAGYFFVNSVKMIREICDASELLNSEVRIICADTASNRKRLGDYDISSSLDEEQMFNFITSCSFKGLDFYSESGIIFVVSNNRNYNSLVTIDTDIIQISGRIRNADNPFRNYLCHIFNCNPLELNREQFDLLVKEKEDNSRTMLSGYSKLSGDEKRVIISALSLDSFYISLDEDGIPFYDELLVLLDKRRYEDIEQVYKEGISIHNCYKKVDKFNVTDTNSLEAAYLADNSFYTLCKDAVGGKGDIDKIYAAFPLIKDAIEILGKDKIRKLHYNITNITKALDDYSKIDRIKDEANRVLDTDRFYTTKDMKILLSRIYRNLGVNKTAKATDIEEILGIKKVNKWIDGKTQKGYILTSN